MAIPQWTGRQSLAQPNINPTAAIAGASQAFGNISDTIQREEMAKQQEAYRQQQLAQQQDQFSQQQGLQEDKLLFDKGANARAVQARLAEESRQKAAAADRYKLFSSKSAELDNAQLQGFSLSPDTFAALKNSGLNDEQIADLESQAKSKNSDMFIDRNKTLSGLTDYIASTGQDPAQFAPLFDSYKSKYGMGGVDEGTRDFAEKLALANIRSGGSGRSGSGGSGGSGGTSDANFARNVSAINDEELFRNGSDSWYKDWFPGEKTKVYKQDVTRIAEHALATSGIRPMYIAQAIKADMDEGQTSYNLADIATNPNDKNYQGILAAASLMQNAGNSGGSAGQGGGRIFNEPSPGDIGSAEFALSLGRGYQPNNQQQRQKALTEMARSAYPQLFSSEKTATTSKQAPSTPEAKLINDALGNDLSGKSGSIPTEEKKNLIFNLAKEASAASAEPGQVVVGPGGQFAPAISRKTPEQKELSSLVRIMEQRPEPLVEMPNTPEFRLFPDRWKDPNPAIKKANAELAKEQDRAYDKAFKIFNKSNEPKPERVKPEPVVNEERVLSQNDLIRARLEQRRAEFNAFKAQQ